MSRNRRVLFGVIGCLLSFASSFLAVNVATSVADWNHPALIPLVGTLFFMVLFVLLMVGGMLSLISVATESETKNDQKRT